FIVPRAGPLCPPAATSPRVTVLLICRAHGELRVIAASGSTRRARAATSRRLAVLLICRAHGEVRVIAASGSTPCARAATAHALPIRTRSIRSATHAATVDWVADGAPGIDAANEVSVWPEPTILAWVAAHGRLVRVNAGHEMAWNRLVTTVRARGGGETPECDQQ